MIIANVFTQLLLGFPLLFAAAPAPPAPDEPLPRTTAAIVGDFQRTDAGLGGAIASWRSRDPGLVSRGAPEDVQLWALREERILMLLRDRPRLADAVLPRLSAALRRATVPTLRAMTDLERLAPRHPPRRRFRSGPPLPAGTLLRFYHAAAHRSHVAWNVLAAVNFVESAFDKFRSDSIAGAQGPMQFLPSTWRTYGLGGDIHDPHDAILGAARFLRAAGAPASYRRALYAYNPSPLYVDAVLRYAKRIGRSMSAFLAYYSSPVFVRTPAGRLRQLTGPR